MLLYKNFYAQRTNFNKKTNVRTYVKGGHGPL